MPGEATIREQAAARWKEYMLAGDFEAAWRESDLIEGTGYQDPHRYWNGESWRGKRVMLRCLHGLGDSIQFIRYAPMLRQTCSHLTVQTHPELVRLIRTAAGIDEAVSWEAPEQWDVQLEVTELPRAFRTTLSTIPRNVPYLRVNSRPQMGNGFRVGLVWQSSQWNPARSIPFDLLAPLLERSGLVFHFLQKDAEAYGWDVWDTAEQMSGLDLVISVDTMCAHLAGALGKPVLILLPFDADWRWMKQRTDSPWYPTARLFRQKEGSGWDEVVQAVCRYCDYLIFGSGAETDVCNPRSSHR